MMSQESEVLMGYPGYNKIVSDRQSATSEESASLFDAINQRFLVFHWKKTLSKFACFHRFVSTSFYFFLIEEKKFLKSKPK